jgi:biotin synthase
MKHIISEIKKFYLAITLSIGEKTFEEYEIYKESGADRYLIRIETTDKELYTKLDPKMDWENRIRCIEDLRKLGYEVGTGCLVGIPNQSLESLADDILFFKKINADMIGIGPFIPNENTPLKDEKGGSLGLALKVMAITRLLLPDINIPATTAMETLNPDGRSIALQCGANVVMPNVTQGEYRKFYEIYPGKICVNDTPDRCRGCIEGKINKINRTISKDYGFRKRK